MIELAEPSWLLIGVVFAASLLQAVTGIGFGVVAGPMLLVTMGSGSAIQVSILLSLAAAAIVSPSTLPRVDWALLKPLFAGVCVGSLLGVLLFRLLSLGQLKLIAAAAVLAMCVVASGLLARHPLFRRDSAGRRFGVGVAAGALNASLAMPGPPIAAYSTAIREDKLRIRATTLVTFLFAYPIAFALQAASVGVGEETLPTAAALLAPTVVGTLLGQFTGRWLPERLFRYVVIGFLLASALALLASL